MATAWPRCIIAMVSHSSSASSMSWVVIRIVVPNRSRSPRRGSHTMCRATGSRPTVGSSRNRTAGWCIMDCAISNRRIITPGIVADKGVSRVFEGHEPKGFSHLLVPKRALDAI